jgi:hypothetical protein
VVRRDWLLYGYWSGIYIDRDVALDSSGTSKVGYGFTGSSNSNNRYVQEITVGVNRTLWKDAKFGALNLMGQYLYLFREPWYVAPTASKAAHDNTIFVDLRYALPGGTPTMR